MNFASWRRVWRAPGASRRDGLGARDFIPHGIDAERHRRIPMAIVETSAPRNEAYVRKCGSETIALEK